MLDLNSEDFNREYDEVCEDFKERLYNERLKEWLKYHDDSENLPGVDMNALPFDDLCRLLKELMAVARRYETDGEEKQNEGQSNYNEANSR